MNYRLWRYWTDGVCLGNQLPNCRTFQLPSDEWIVITQPDLYHWNCHIFLRVVLCIYIIFIDKVRYFMGLYYIHTSFVNIHSLNMDHGCPANPLLGWSIEGHWTFPTTFTSSCIHFRDFASICNKWPSSWWLDMDLFEHRVPNKMMVNHHIPINM